MKTYCVATGIIQRDEMFFIAKRADAKKIKPGLWEFVTGFVEDHESAEDTILRELTEEINATGRVIRELDIIQMNEGDERWVILPFLIFVVDPVIHTIPSEHSTGKWVTWKELTSMPATEFRFDLALVEQALQANPAQTS